MQTPSYLDEALRESYHLTFSETTPWAKLPTMQPFTDLFFLGCPDPIFVLPEFYGGRGVILSSADPEIPGSTPFSSFNLIKLIEDSFFSSCEDVTRAHLFSDGEFYQVFLLYCTLSE